MKPSFSNFITLIFSLLLISCEGIDCTVNNVVMCHYTFYASGSEDVVSVKDTLTITAEGTDSVLYNKGVNVSKLSLPMSHWKEADTLNFTFKSSTQDYSQQMSLYIRKDNIPHFENPDCPTTMFHQITGIDLDSPTHCVDSVVIANPLVNYATQENIKIYLRISN